MPLSRVTFFICFLIAATPCFGQEAKREIIYTGRLMGYFRSPDKQGWNEARGCAAAPEASSKAATEFQNFRKLHPSAVLVGTGDNFAPELTGRIFDPKPLPGTLGVPPGEYAPGNKELYYWYETPQHRADSWLYYKSLPDDLEKQLSRGEGIIPTDNVGCFLATNRFAAIVPGKHDFYFGIERVRELARFMATLETKDVPNLKAPSDSQSPNPKSRDEFQPPQMLGANLVIKTSRTDPPPAAAKPRSKWEGASLKIGDGKSIYPWYVSTATVRIQSPDSKAIRDNLDTWFTAHPSPTLDEVETFLSQPMPGLDPEEVKAKTKLQTFVRDLKTTKICPTNEFNYVPGGCPNGWEVTGDTVSGNGEGINYVIPTIPKGLKRPWSGAEKAPFFEPGRNYGLCLTSNLS
ncbi:MAG TPA: hypothetical protein VGC60_01265, partial [Pyrinomonadaceae bacterium]